MKLYAILMTCVLGLTLAGSTPAASAQSFGTTLAQATSSQQQDNDRTRVRGRSVKGLIKLGGLVLVGGVAAGGYVLRKINGE